MVPLDHPQVGKATLTKEAEKPTKERFPVAKCPNCGHKNWLAGVENCPYCHSKKNSIPMKEAERSLPNRVIHQGGEYFHTGKIQDGKAEYAHFENGKTTGKKVWKKL